MHSSYFPLFKNRIRYNRYGFSNIKENKYVPGANDGNRVLSLKADLAVLKQNPLGVGGDVVNKTCEWYDRNVPQMMAEENFFSAVKY